MKLGWTPGQEVPKDHPQIRTAIMLNEAGAEAFAEALVRLTEVKLAGYLRDGQRKVQSHSDQNRSELGTSSGERTNLP